MNINTNKKIPTVVTIVSICVLLYGLLAKEYDPFKSKDVYLLTKNGYNIPISYYHVEILWFEMKYLNLMLMGLVCLAFGVYWFFYKEDKEVKESMIKTKTYAQSLAKKGIGRLNGKMTLKKVLIYLGVLLFLVGFAFIVKYYFDLNSSSQPKSLSQSIFMGIMDTGSKLLIIGILITIIQVLFMRNKR